MKITNELNLPQPFVSAAESEHRYTPKRYSATAVLKGVREAILQRRHDDEIEQDAADMVWAVFGSAVHSILENSQETDSQLKENYLVVDMPNGYQLSGIFDLYDDATGTVTDYKTASTWKVIFGNYLDWRKQVLIYVWMLRQIGFPARTGQIVAMLKDHKKSEVIRKADYPKHPVVVVQFDFTNEEIEKCGEWLKERFEAIEQAEKLPDNELPVCTEEERWHRPDKYAVMKKGRRTAVRVYDSEFEANERAQTENAQAGKDLFSVEFRPGSDPKCESYCSACEFCNYYHEHVKED